MTPAFTREGHSAAIRGSHETRAPPLVHVRCPGRRPGGLDDAPAAEPRIAPEPKMTMRYPVTPDGRYFVVRGRLWRCSNPALGAEERGRLTRELMKARRDVGAARRAADPDAERDARRRVHEAKVALGERGSVWWEDGAQDFNRYLVKNTPYRSWYASIAP